MRKGVDKINAFHPLNHLFLIELIMCLYKILVVIVIYEMEWRLCGRDGRAGAYPLRAVGAGPGFMGVVARQLVPGAQRVRGRSLLVAVGRRDVVASWTWSLYITGTSK